MKRVERITTKTARFSAVVEACGAPKTATLWVKPEQDKDFAASMKANRVMTVIREPVGTAKDYGLVGFLKRPAATYLVFPKSLSEFADKRIVGIKYDLIHEPEAKDPVTPGRRLKEIAKPQTIRTQPPSRFKVQIKLVATATETIEVEVQNKKEAGAKALVAAKLDFTKADVKKSITSIRPANARAR